jgi:hypothetical protein
MIRKLNLCLILLVLIFKINGCKKVSLPHSIGGRDEVILIAPDEFKVDSFINQLERVEYYPTEEKVFNVKRVGISEIDRYKLWRNVIIVGNFEESYINDLLGTDAKEELKKGAQLFLEKDLWVRLQTAVIITGVSTEETQGLLNRSAATIYRVLREEERERFASVVFMQGYQKKETKKMETLLGASFKIPLGYRLAKDEDGFMSYIRKNPDRLVTLLYRVEPIKNPIRFRDSLFLEHFNGDEVVVDSIPITTTEDGAFRYLKLTSLDTVKFKDVKAVQIKGVWKNDKLKGGPMGGPFVSCIFQKDGIWYFLDGHVFAPGKKKWPFLEEVNIILDTFEKEN